METREDKIDRIKEVVVEEVVEEAVEEAEEEEEDIDVQCCNF